MDVIVVNKQAKKTHYGLDNAFGYKFGAVTISAVLLFFILNTVKITLFNYFLMQDQATAIIGYKLGLTALSLVIIFTVLFKIKSRTVFIAVYIVQVLYMLVNISYYLYFQNYLHIMQSISLITEAFSVAGHSDIPLSPKMLAVFIDLPVFIYIVIHYTAIINMRVRLRIFFRAAALISLAAILSIEVVNFSHSYSILLFVHDKFSGESLVVKRYGTVINNIVNISQDSGNREMISQLHYGKEQTNKTVSQEKPNFVIIQVEAMDSNIINQQYKGRYITPYLHSLSGKSIYYPYTLSYHEGGGTSDCEFSIINSVEALQSYPALKLSNYNFPNSMVSKLSAASYDTLAFHGNVASFYNRDIAFPKLGFKEFYDMTKMKIHESGWGLPDNNVFDYNVNKLKTVKQPFLSYMITMSSHGPFNSVRNYYNNSLYDSISEKSIKNYFNSFSYVDQSIKNFITDIESNFKNTYIIIVGDHTPNIGSKLYKQASFTIDDKYFEFVPLIIITPDHAVYKEQNKVATFMDIAPTILNASGIKFVIKSDGQDLIESNTIDGNIPYKGGSFDRALLFKKAADTLLTFP